MPLQEYARKKHAGKEGFEESMQAKLQKQEARRQKRQQKRAPVMAAAAQAITQYGMWLCWHLACGCSLSMHAVDPAVSHRPSHALSQRSV